MSVTRVKACLDPIALVMAGATVILFATSASAETRFTPSLTVSERFDDNVRFAATNRESDFTTIVTPALLVTGRAQEVDISGNVGASWTQYVKHTDLSRVGFHGSLGLQADTLASRLLPGLQFKLTDSAIYTQEFPEFAALGTPTQPASGGVQTGRFNTFGNNLVANTSYAISGRTNLSGGYVNSYTRFTGTNNLVTTRSNTFFGGSSYAVSPVTTFLDNYSYSRFSFAGGTHIESHAADVGLRRIFASDLTVEGRVGVSYVPSLDRLSPNFDASATKKFFSTDVGARVARSITSTGGLSAQVATQDLASLAITQRMTPSLTAILTGNYSTRKSVGARTVDIQSYSPSASLNYAVTKTTSVSASYSHFYQHSEGTLGNSLDRNLVYINLTVTWP